ncbi:MAG TPA: hypothetical protein VJ810_13360 [Blastocatellia bacterium]|nr:hypothetical protein [Blastocatellia bacterium]
MTRIAKSFKAGFALIALSWTCAGAWQLAGPTAARQDPLLAERAYQDREILYELQEPQTHAFRITHDYTERKDGAMHYFNVVRAGSRVSDPESIDLDSGESLKWEILSGKQVIERKLPLADVGAGAEVVVTYLARPVANGSTTRLRLKETYTDPKSYYLDGEELVWDRALGRLRNTVILPAGWRLTSLASPGVIQTLPDGRLSVYIVNPRNDDVRVYLRARRRAIR